MRTTLLTAGIALLAMTMTAAHADDSWKGPGWYQVFDDGHGIVMIWSGTYPDEAACTNYVKQKFADQAYVQSMIVKYGDPQVWSFSCPYLKEDLPD